MNTLANSFAKIRNYIKETQLETKKIIWPSGKFIFTATLIILVVVFLSSIFLAVTDLGLSKMMQFLMATFKTVPVAR